MFLVGFITVNHWTSLPFTSRWILEKSLCWKGNSIIINLIELGTPNSLCPKSYVSLKLPNNYNPPIGYSPSYTIPKSNHKSYWSIECGINDHQNHTERCNKPIFLEWINELLFTTLGIMFTFLNSPRIGMEPLDTTYCLLLHLWFFG